MYRAQMAGCGHTSVARAATSGRIAGLAGSGGLQLAQTVKIDDADEFALRVDQTTLLKS